MERLLTVLTFRLTRTVTQCAFYSCYRLVIMEVFSMQFPRSYIRLIQAIPLLPLQSNPPPKARLMYSQFSRCRLINSAKPGLGFYVDTRIFPVTFNLRTRRKISLASARRDSFLFQSDLWWYQRTVTAFRNFNAGRIFVFPFYNVYSKVLLFLYSAKQQATQIFVGVNSDRAAPDLNSNF